MKFASLSGSLKPQQTGQFILNGKPHRKLKVHTSLCYGNNSGDEDSADNMMSQKYLLPKIKEMLR
jgi:hypothetical protein